MFKHLKFKQGPYNRQIDNVNNLELEISDMYALRIYRTPTTPAGHSETFVLLDTTVPNPEGPLPTRRESECLTSIIHASKEAKA